MSTKEMDWKVSSEERQLRYFLTLGKRLYDEIELTDLFQLKKKVGFATCGRPGELPSQSNYYTGYSEEQLAFLKKLCDLIIEKSDINDGFVHFACIFLVIYNNRGICETPLFRILTKSGNSVFIDPNGRVYLTWSDYMTGNTLPACEYCYPLDGIYSAESGKVLLGFTESPASSLTSKAAECLDTVGTVAALGAAGLGAASVFVAVAPAALATAGVAAATTGVYSVCRNAHTLYDRNKHEQPIGITDPEARSAWMSIATSAIGVGTAGATAKAQEVVESGRSLSKASLFGLRALNATSLVFSGFGFVDTFITCVDKYKRGNLTKKDVFDLSCEILFLFNAVANAKATHELISNMNTVITETPAMQKKLTKTQKRNLRKRNAKRRAKGLSTTNASTEINESTQNEKKISTLELSPVVMQLLTVAAREYEPRLSDVTYVIESIGHDIMAYRAGELDITYLLLNLLRALHKLWEKYTDDISNMWEIVVKYLSSTVEKIKDYLCRLFENSNDEQQSEFGLRLINVEDQIETVINDASRDVLQLQEELGAETDEQSSEEFENADNGSMLGDENDTPYSAQVFNVSVKMVDMSSLSCLDLQEFGDIVEGVSCVIIEDFKSNMSNYSKSVKAAKSVSGKLFNLDVFHSGLGIEGDVVEHVFKTSMDSVYARGTVFKIKTKCKEIQAKRHSATYTPVWEAISNGVLHHYGAFGKGHLSSHQLLALVSDIVQTNLTEDNCKLVEQDAVIMIDIEGSDGKAGARQVVIYHDLTPDNTASLLILVYGDKSEKLEKR